MSLLEKNSVLDWIKMTPKYIEWMKMSRKKDGKSIAKKEKNWGTNIIGKNTNQWTNMLGELLVKELLEKQGYLVYRPKMKKNYKPDWETNDTIWEVKTRSYTVPGTAGEKILGCPFKYAEIPEIYEKPLNIVVVGYQEYEAIHDFGLFSENSKQKKKILEVFESLNIKFVKCSSLITN